MCCHLYRLALLSNPKSLYLAWYGSRVDTDSCVLYMGGPDLCAGCGGSTFSGILSLLSAGRTGGRRCEAFYDDGMLSGIDRYRWIDSVYVCHDDACSDQFHYQNDCVHAEQGAPAVSGTVSKEGNPDRRSGCIRDRQDTEALCGALVDSGIYQPHTNVHRCVLEIDKNSLYVLSMERSVNIMRARQFAICDSDENYLKMLQAYLQKKKLADFEILIFDTIRGAEQASIEEPFEILLVGENIYDTDVTKIKAVKTFILQEDGVKVIAGYSIIAKYQSMERLIAQVLEEFALDESCNSTSRCGRNQTTFISFYAPDRNRGQSAAAFGAAQVLADMGYQVLYINLLPFTGFEELLQTSYEADVTDFLYFALNHSDKLLYKLNSLKRSVHGVDYLPPALDYTDLLVMNRDDWQRVMDLLLYSSDYTHVVMDLSETCQGFYDMLERSDQIYVLADKRIVYGCAMLSHFMNLLKAKEYEKILNHMTVFELPEGWDVQDCGLDTLALSVVGTCMKGVLGIS